LRPGADIVVADTDGWTVRFYVFGLGNSSTNHTVKFDDETAQCTPGPVIAVAADGSQYFDCVGSAATSPTNLGTLRANVTKHGLTSALEPVAVVSPYNFPN